MRVPVRVGVGVLDRRAQGENRLLKFNLLAVGHVIDLWIGLGFGLESGLWSELHCRTKGARLQSGTKGARLQSGSGLDWGHLDIDVFIWGSVPGNAFSMHSCMDGSKCAYATHGTHIRRSTKEPHPWTRVRVRVRVI